MLFGSGATLVKPWLCRYDTAAATCDDVVANCATNASRDIVCPAAIADFTVSTSRICRPRTISTGLAGSSAPRSVAFAGAIEPVSVATQPDGAVTAVLARVVRL